MYKENVLQPIITEATHYSFDRNNIIDKFSFKKEPELKPLPKILILPEIEYNPIFSQIKNQIANDNLITQFKESYDNINYQPISGTGNIRGYSKLNSKPIGIKQGFTTPLFKLTNKLQSPSPSPPSPSPSIKKEFISSQSPISNPFLDSSESYKPSPEFEKTDYRKEQPKTRSKLFKKLQKAAEESQMPGKFPKSGSNSRRKKFNKQNAPLFIDTNIKKEQEEEK